MGTIAMHEPFTYAYTRFALAKDVQRINSLITRKGYNNCIECNAYTDTWHTNRFEVEYVWNSLYIILMHHVWIKLTMSKSGFQVLVHPLMDQTFGASGCVPFGSSIQCTIWGFQVPLHPIMSQNLGGASGSRV